MPEKNRTPMDDAFDTLLRAAASRAANEMFDEIDASIPDEDIHFSENHIKAMNNILYGSSVDFDNNDLKHFKLKRRYILVAAITMTFLISTAVCADRLKFLDYFMNISKEGTEFRIDENNEDESTYMYRSTLNYIPENFYLDKNELTSTSYVVTYKDSNSYFTFYKSLDNNVFDVNTENATTQKVHINDNVALLNIGDNFVNISWVDNDVLYNISGNLDKETIIKIAENIE